MAKKQTSPSKTILITGASTGFGRATALHLLRAEWCVFATVRKEDDRDSLRRAAIAEGLADRLTVSLCDVTDDAQVAALGRELAATIPRLDALMNNAGTAYAGPLELLPPDDLRAQLAVNTVAPLVVTQAVLPLLKAAKGTIINISSVGGRFASPVIGAYAASKFALEALSDAWRIELAPFGVRVVLIEPSSSPTAIWQTSAGRSGPQLAPHERGPYAPLIAVFTDIAAAGAKNGFPPEALAALVGRILATRRPHARYVIPRNMGRVIALSRLLPTRLVDRVIRRSLKW